MKTNFYFYCSQIELVDCRHWNVTVVLWINNLQQLWSMVELDGRLLMFSYSGLLQAKQLPQISAQKNFDKMKKHLIVSFCSHINSILIYVNILERQAEVDSRHHVWRHRHQSQLLSPLFSTTWTGCPIVWWSTRNWFTCSAKWIFWRTFADEVHAALLNWLALIALTTLMIVLACTGPLGSPTWRTSRSHTRSAWTPTRTKAWWPIWSPASRCLPPFLETLGGLHPQSDWAC